ncbi:kinase-like protein [Auricularia subglabra TFB-10046 SS5]|nr:kinase-like protein [Auricularia subglabra TFB-10046 SS5]
MRVAKDLLSYWSFPLDMEATSSHAQRPSARGGFSDIFRLVSPTYGVLAVKRLRLDETKREDLEKLVAKEAHVLSLINHPHILPFLGITYMDGSLCLVTPWAENGSMGGYLRGNPEADRFQLLAQVASALGYLHTNAGDIIIHGDIHLDNVLISDKGSALLSDFGLSRVVPEGHSSSLYRGDSSKHSFGRDVYAAPELCDGRGQPLSWATDVFAFGMLIFHAFSGEQPFGKPRNGYPIAIVMLSRGLRPERREITRRDFSDALWELVQRCWQHDVPRARPRMPEVCAIMQRLVGLRDEA